MNNEAKIENWLNDRVKELGGFLTSLPRRRIIRVYRIESTYSRMVLYGL